VRVVRGRIARVHAADHQIAVTPLHGSTDELSVFPGQSEPDVEPENVAIQLRDCGRVPREIPEGERCGTCYRRSPQYFVVDNADVSGKIGS
jgi:hypothetical protein